MDPPDLAHSEVELPDLDPWHAARLQRLLARTSRSEAAQLRARCRQLSPQERALTLMLAQQLDDLAEMRAFLADVLAGEPDQET